MNGTVVRLVPARRFGFIRAEDGAEYFFHNDNFKGFFEDLATDFKQGQRIRVTFDTMPSPKGTHAVDVVRDDWPNQ